ALAFNSRNATDTRTELGARFDRLLLLNPEAALTLRGRVAWAHDRVSDPSLAPVFQALPGASFVVNGATPAKNSALTSAGAELRQGFPPPAPLRRRVRPALHALRRPRPRAIYVVGEAAPRESSLPRLKRAHARP